MEAKYSYYIIFTLSFLHNYRKFSKFEIKNYISVILIDIPVFEIFRRSNNLNFQQAYITNKNKNDNSQQNI